MSERGRNEMGGEIRDGGERNEEEMLGERDRMWT